MATPTPGIRRGSIRRLELASLIEGSTLSLLVFLAVPLKHWGGYSALSAWLGPIHGGAFLFYLWRLATVAAEEGWPASRALRWAAAAVVPLGTFVAVHRHRRSVGPPAPVR